MPLDKDKAVLLFESIVHKSPSYCEDTDSEHMPDDLKLIVTDFAQAIYELCVKEEREKNANTIELIANGHELKAMTTTEQDEINELRSVAWKFKVCAEAIRKG